MVNKSPLKSRGGERNGSIGKELGLEAGEYSQLLAECALTNQDIRESVFQADIDSPDAH